MTSSAVRRVIISVRVCPASTWQCLHAWLHRLPTLTCSVSTPVARSVPSPAASSFSSKALFDSIFSVLLKRVYRNANGFVPKTVTGGLDKRRRQKHNRFTILNI